MLLALLLFFTNTAHTGQRLLDGNAVLCQQGLGDDPLEEILRDRFRPPLRAKILEEIETLSSKYDISQDEVALAFLRVIGSEQSEHSAGRALEKLKLACDLKLTLNELTSQLAGIIRDLGQWEIQTPVGPRKVGLRDADATRILRVAVREHIKLKNVVPMLKELMSHPVIKKYKPYGINDTNVIADIFESQAVAFDGLAELMVHVDRSLVYLSTNYDLGHFTLEDAVKLSKLALEYRKIPKDSVEAFVDANGSLERLRQRLDAQMPRS